ncbi:hypothetical protein HK102_005871 [Quaeritorhiza haematococci]|nr:hypothetical protein HK102_005871 [Quaeritorhiza haematococci]
MAGSYAAPASAPAASMSSFPASAWVIPSESDLDDQFEDLPYEPNIKASPLARVGGKRKFASKNRYTNILPFDDTRVRINLPRRRRSLASVAANAANAILTVVTKPQSASSAASSPSSNSFPSSPTSPTTPTAQITSPLDDDVEDSYINASYITSPFNPSTRYISTQFPVKPAFADFWRMVLQTRSRVIAVLSRIHEGGHKKGDLYWPEEFGVPVEVDKKRLMVTRVPLDQHSLPRGTTADEDNEEATIVVRRFVLTGEEVEACEDIGENGFQVTQIHYQGWPDFGVPDDPEEFLQVLKAVRQYAPESTIQSPWITHCSAGVGRSGTFLAIDAILRTLKIGSDTPAQLPPSKELVFQTVQEFRRQRNLMVQQAEQYAFIFHAVKRALEDGDF